MNTTNKPGRPPLNKPAVSVKIYESDKQQMQIIKNKTGKPIIEQISEMVNGKIKEPCDVCKDDIYLGYEAYYDAECNHQINEDEQCNYCPNCGRELSPQIIDEMARERKSEV